MKTAVELTRKERSVLTDALAYYVENLAGEEHLERLEGHLESAEEEGVVRVQPGEEELFRDVFRGYARALQETVGHDGAPESMGTFYESVFKSVVEKVESAGGQRAF
ncbi:hypothetical protein ACFO0N_17030 [Halobium salinum]|uniref:Uncharacterized protein n=1 Tax=Halobium salinum TaxID=1364940 RepID=A0ABD5PG69_9EURY|nr:hypothetical protein [Halobium salinum]